MDVIVGVGEGIAVNVAVGVAVGKGVKVGISVGSAVGLKVGICAKGTRVGKATGALLPTQADRNVNNKSPGQKFRPNLHRRTSMIMADEGHQCHQFLEFHVLVRFTRQYLAQNQPRKSAGIRIGLPVSRLIHTHRTLPRASNSPSPARRII